MPATHVTGLISSSVGTEIEGVIKLQSSVNTETTTGYSSTQGHQWQKCVNTAISTTETTLTSITVEVQNKAVISYGVVLRSTGITPTGYGKVRIYRDGILLKEIQLQFYASSGEDSYNYTHGIIEDVTEGTHTYSIKAVKVDVSDLYAMLAHLSVVSI